MTNQQIQAMTKDQKDIYEHKLMNSKEWKIEEVCKYISNKRLKPLFNRQDVKLRSEGENLTICRNLGHSKDIPGSGQWRMLPKADMDTCWVCGSWIYTLLFWHPDIGIFMNNNTI